MIYFVRSISQTYLMHLTLLCGAVAKVLPDHITYRPSAFVPFDNVVLDLHLRMIKLVHICAEKMISHLTNDLFNE